MINSPILFSNCAVPCSWGGSCWAVVRSPLKPSEDPKPPTEDTEILFVTSLSFAGTAAAKLRVDALLLEEDDLNRPGVGIVLRGRREKGNRPLRSKITQIYSQNVD